ncbi:MAG: polysaccharide biosynthesis/export family protein [Blastocatellia bacterium]
MILTVILHEWPRLLSILALLALPASSVFAQQPVMNTEASPSVNDGYRIRGGDKLSIKFLYQPELNEPAVIVRPDGFITLPMIDEVMAKGLTVAELKSSIEKAYSESLRSPVVSINLVEFVAPRVFVGGQVMKPGSYDLRAGQTLMQAIILAGGFTRDANRKMVLHARPDGATGATGGSKLKMATFDAMRMLDNSAIAQEVSLQDGDYIFVPDSKLSKMSRILEAFRAAIPGIGIGVTR